MPIINSQTGRTTKTYTIPQLKEAANYMRGLNLVALNCAGSGHAGGTLSIMDVAAALYLKVARHDPKNPDWDERDRVVWSGGHKAPALYVSLGMAGYFPPEQVVTLRKLESPFQGHPHWLKLRGVEVSTGSLGQGLGIAVGMALRAKLDKKKHRIFAITGDGEWDEGSMWEALMSASHYRLDNLTIIVDRNYLQIDGPTEEVMRLDPLEKRFASFGAQVVKVNGHDMQAVVQALDEKKIRPNQPLLILARTTKGKGVSYMENKAEWHGVAPNDEQLAQALKELGLSRRLDVAKLQKMARTYQQKMDRKVGAMIPRYQDDYFWNRKPEMKVQMEPTRSGFGNALAKAGGNKKVVCLGLDISGSVKISKMYEGYPERKDRFFSMGIQEQNATVVAGGLAKEGKWPVLSTYGVFISQRNADQMRTTVCYGDLNVLFGGAHGGISVGMDGATHQSLEEIAVVGILPNMNLIVPCDALETEKATGYALTKLTGPKYIRFAREATPVITDTKTPFVFGKANVIRLRKIGPAFKDAFATVLAEKYRDEKEQAAIFACGPEVPEAMRAAWILKQEYRLETRVINMHTVKPLDVKTIIRTAREVPIIVTAEEHQKGGFGNLIAGTIMEANLGYKVKFGMIGVNDRFGESGQPWELVHYFGLSAEFIAQKVIELKRGKR